MKQAILYSRVSSQEQVKGDGPDRQRRNGERYIHNQGWVLVDTLSDQGKSAYHGRNRIEGSELHQFELEARNGLHVDKVLCVENVDRLSRQGAKAAAQLIWGLNDNGVDVATWHDGVVYRAGGNSGSDGLLDLFGLILKSQMSYEEIAKKADRIQEKWKSRHERISEGQQIGKSGTPSKICPFWIDIEDNRYVLNDAHAATINQIFDWYIDGIGLDLIAKKLNEAKVPSKAAYRKTERGWGKTKLHQIITRREVIGEYTTRKGKTLSTSYYPEAVTLEKFYRAAEAMNKRKRSGGSEIKRAANVLTGLVRCGYCGANGVYETQTGTVATYMSKSKGLRTYQRASRRTLRCDRNRRKMDCANSTILKYEIVEQTIFEGMLPYVVNKGQSEKATQDLREQIAQLAREKEAVDQAIANLLDQLEDGESGAVRTRMNTREAQARSQQDQIESLQAQLAIRLATPSEVEDSALILALLGDLNSENEPIRLATSKRVNSALRRIMHKIEIEWGQFRVWIDETEWYLFDMKGSMLESQGTY
jgi:DNA invertase Pin-like site-specific DNA recombinase